MPLGRCKAVSTTNALVLVASLCTNQDMCAKGAGLPFTAASGVKRGECRVIFSASGSDWDIYSVIGTQVTGAYVLAGALAGRLNEINSRALFCTQYVCRSPDSMQVQMALK